METLFEVWARARLVPRNTTSNTGSGRKYRWFNVHPHLAWDKLTNSCFNRSICQGYCSTLLPWLGVLNKLLPPLASEDDPTYNLNILSETVYKAKYKHLPEHIVNKHKHSLSQWITMGIIWPIVFRDQLYLKLNKHLQTQTNTDVIKLT